MQRNAAEKLRKTLVSAFQFPKTEKRAKNKFSMSINAILMFYSFQNLTRRFCALYTQILQFDCKKIIRLGFGHIQSAQFAFISVDNSFFPLLGINIKMFKNEN